MMHVDKASGYINPAAFENFSLDEYFKDCFNESGKAYLLIAEEDGKIAGFAKVNLQDIQSFFVQKKVLYIDDIYTMESFRNRGVGSSLLKEAEKLAIEKNVKWLKARIYSFNKPSQGMFESAGYENLYSEYFRRLD